MLKPRPYQAAALERIQDGHEPGFPAPMIVHSTGTGKTETGLALARSYVERGERVLWLAHRSELVSDPVARWSRYYGPGDCGIIQADRNQCRAAFVSASYQTLRSERRLAAYLAHGKPGLVIVDECHRSPSPTYAELLERLSFARLLGVTATPEHATGDLARHWRIVHAYDTVCAIRDGWLLPPWVAVDRVPELDLGSIRTRGDDFDPGELGAALIAGHIVEHTVAAMTGTHTWRRICGPDGPEEQGPTRLAPLQLPAIVYTATVEQARLTAEALPMRAAVVSGDTPPEERRRLLEQARKGEIDAVCNAVVWTEGTDIPSLGTVVMARPFRSWVLYMQALGRGLRRHGDLQWAGILDLVDTCSTHSLVAAPVLLSEEQCDHAYNDDGECVLCGHEVPCPLSRTGQHDYRDGECRHCKRLQCEHSEDGKHLWVPVEDHHRECMHCQTRMRDPLRGLVERKTADLPSSAVPWHPVPGLEGVYALHLGTHGLAYMVQSEEGFRPAWVPPRARNVRWLAEDWLPPGHARALVAQLARQALGDVKPDEEGYIVRGRTYAIKGQIKRAGGYWDRRRAAWRLPARSARLAVRMGMEPGVSVEKLGVKLDVGRSREVALRVGLVEAA